MRMNEFDDDLKYKKRRTSDTVFIIKIVFIILTIFAILSSVLFISKMGSSDSYEIEEKVKDMEIVNLLNIKEKFLLLFLVEEDIF